MANVGPWRVRQIFLDCDGVLADFDSAAVELFAGQHPRRAREHHGEREFWHRIRTAGKFYRDLPLLPDAMQLYRAVKHLHPIILTGCPVGGWAEQQKREWVAEHFPGVEIITCRAKEKFMHMKHPGDVLVDDYLRFKEIWEEAGGIFVQHTSAAESIRKLAELGFDVRTHAESAA
jgi:5'(3')-deoxyribonucleotidase